MSDSNSIPPDGFRVIPGYPRYAIDENGEVLSICPRNGRGKDKPWENAIHVKRCTNLDGYHVVTLSRDKKQRVIKVQHLVLLTFIGPCPDGMVCRHLDGNRINNNVSNLSWGTPLENSQDMVSHGTSSFGGKNGMSKLTSDDVLKIRARYANGETQKSIAKDFPVAWFTISEIVRRKRWKHI